ncbi:MAG: glutamine synthetase family protein [Pseudomonadota bacterium]
MTAKLDKLTGGSLEKLGLLNDRHLEQAAACMQQIAGSGIETVRVLFADQHGILRGKTIVADAFASLFDTGICVPNTLLLKDTSHRTVFPVWTEEAAGLPAGAADLLLVPDPSTFRRLPWSDHSAWIFCTPTNRNGSPLPLATRSILQNAIGRLDATGRTLKVGLEVEFQVFAVANDRLDHAAVGMPGQAIETRNTTQGYQLLTELLYDQAEPLLDDLRRTAQAMNLPVRSMEVEMGPSQYEFTFDPARPMEHADNMVMFRTMVKEVCARKGLHATFMCKPNLPKAAANGWHIHQSLCSSSGENLMLPARDGAISQDSSAWIAGLLEHAEASCLLTTPTVNGYKRYQPHQLAPDRMVWGWDNRGAMIRGLMAPGNETSRIENRVAEPAANPYLVFASQILCGLDGLERGLSAPEPVETPYMDGAKQLPDSLISAIGHFESSQFYRTALGDGFVDYLAKIRRAEWDRYHQTVSNWEQSEYFNLY